MTSLNGQTIGFIGLGLMGRPMCRNLIRAGARVVATTRSPGALKEIEDAGAETVATPRAVAEAADMVIIIVVDTAAVDGVLNGPDGVLAGVGPDSLVIDMGTTAVKQTQAFAALVEKAGGRYLDAPVSGGTAGAEQAGLTIMAGGGEEDLERARPVFAVLGSRLTHIGGVGAGQVAKAANQVIVALNIGAVAEAFMLAAHAGADPAKVREALKGGFADSTVLNAHGQRMIDRAFTPGGKSVTQRKDLTQALDLAAEVGVDMPATRLAKDLYDRLVENGDGDLDHSALIKVLDGGWTD